ncbi:hypothetical protein BASA50_002595 [Batrachochytrium salamandrivorans]|uniref:Phospho-2-dehydro-3-deoxyheptonate aldolase n=1 Tax=Batrachochytrium salamandrivorans TaxID=1357716 RepID=A0ABQ8FKR2_9FUNG|nr:hypothetical protein BASA60_009258 [Batrachochytrium salamandrivorans]KAH6574791.1 hypothetical protein BASA62_002278 [Batrachochytrium salamandrivorans]KAH6600007.1 hypothetical protein BASA50_002595 [Batrachochytrium salamandrivorans]KAH9251252.1 3-deoxy-7-phosphoheptulonate synthase [Batrachochytrium salamandrivorans]KAH9271269.1 3-deoxy-7-phosphoheptulonate synthase [Batrachochytrium salamandrivorans]
MTTGTDMADALHPCSSTGATMSVCEPPHRMHDTLNDLDDNRILNIRPLIPPQILMEDLPLSDAASATVSKARREAEAIVAGEDDRLLVVVGPCSIHDVKAAMEYSALLKAYAHGSAKDDLCIIMRVYFEKPRTTVGWKGLINDPQLDGSFSINKGLRIARQLLLDLNNSGIPAAVEFLDTISPQFIGDLVSWGAIGARTTESQIHRELASGLSVPVGFKNGTDGNVRIAIDAIRAASVGHRFLSVTKQGLSAIVETAGNTACHVILRGSSSTGPNYHESDILACGKALQAASLHPAIMVDCSHGNSEKNHKKQSSVADEVARQLTLSSTAPWICGVMIESHLKEGKQNLPVEYGMSITDACISWEDTVVVLDTLRKGVQARRLNRLGKDVAS